MADQRYLVLARKWRPQQFEDVVGQEHISRTLKNAISSGRIHHAFLFIGSRGIGKTTTARILAKALNCLSYKEPTVTPCGTCENCRAIGEGSSIDVIEIDGASNNKVEDVREIRENIRMVPSSGRYKVYIIDEVHQLSTSAFNALLKTLEEPPPHAIFVLATTEAHKIPATIISRCQRYDFRRVPIPAIVELLRKILRQESIQASDEALYAIARAAEGGVRDAESILDQLISYCDKEITFQDVFDVLGLVDWKVMHTLCDAILNKDIGRLLALVEDVVSSGKDLSQFVQEILRYYRNLLVIKTAQGADLLHLPEEEQNEAQQRAQRYTLTNLIRLVEQFATLTSGFDSQLAQRIALESLLIRISKVGVELSVDTVLEKLLLLESFGTAVVPPEPSDPPRATLVKP
ncbi:MAG TPA: DNA polymerase III subunit gamma/tau [Candidatus Hydrogenedentes bacterium]|nr:DNA polymerase III subunit gamma/tau [Candidatus Hydrogenedentota bacterium]